MLTVVDDLQRLISLEGPARRIVSLVPSLTELFFALGCGDSLVGVTRYCTEPAAGVASVRKIGGTKNPDVPAIVALRPDLVVVNAEENRRQDFDLLEKAGVPLFVSFTQRVADVPPLMRRLGRLAGASETAERLATDLERSLAETAVEESVPRLRVFCPIWKNPWMTFNRDTYTDDMLWRAGGLNVCRGNAERYPTVDLEELASLQPEVMLLPDEPYVFSPRDLPGLLPLANTPAARNGQIHFIDGKALAWYGPRSAAALRDLKKILDACTPGGPQLPTTMPAKLGNDEGGGCAE